MTDINDPWKKKESGMTKDQLQEMLDTALEQQVCNLFKVFVSTIEQDYKADIPFRKGLRNVIDMHKKASDILKDIL